MYPPSVAVKKEQSKDELFGQRVQDAECRKTARTWVGESVGKSTDGRNVGGRECGRDGGTEGVPVGSKGGIYLFIFGC